MELSALYTRRLSGSSSRNSFNEDALEQLEFNINDISRASSPASVTSVSARSEGHGSGFRERRHRNSARGDDDYLYRKKFTKIKGELELERIKARQLQHERVEEMRKLREAFENDKKLEMVSLQHRLEEEKKKELVKLKEDLIKQKDFELQQVLMYKESERKQQVSTKPDGQKEKWKEEEEQKVEERGAVEAEEEEEEQAGRNDGDNDVATVSEKTINVKDSVQDRRKSSLDRKTGDHVSSKTVDTGIVKDGGSSYDGGGGGGSEKQPTKEIGDHKVGRNSARSSSHVDKGDNSGRRSRRGSAVSRSTEKSEKHDVGTTTTTTTTESSNLNASDLASDNTTTTKSRQSSKVKDSKSSTAARASARDVKEIEDKDKGDDDRSCVEDVSDHHQTRRSAEKVAQSKADDVEKRQQLSREYEEMVKRLEQEKALLLRQKEEAQRTLDSKCKEHKVREEEFYRLKEGYERELRTVINEHKKVALGNIEKLKLAETALKEATMSDEEIANLSQRHERQRRLSSSSLPALETKKEDREREKTLQKKLGDLTSQIQRLERRIALLRTENDTLRQKQDEQR
ncbi:cilia- and flagella-associated protein 251, partial [Aplysia californica]|uniref:Cilia- and flagella-associated protein 251 n=1 Tax=Aplysia californica TaxID=6500 RepID=A0ABM0KAU3_APLCA